MHIIMPHDIEPNWNRKRKSFQLDVFCSNLLGHTCSARDGLGWIVRSIQNIVVYLYLHASTTGGQVITRCRKPRHIRNFKSEQQQPFGTCSLTANHNVQQ